MMKYDMIEISTVARPSRMKIHLAFVSKPHPQTESSTLPPASIACNSIHMSNGISKETAESSSDDRGTEEQVLQTLVNLYRHDQNTSTGFGEY